jgi:heme-degrading monooxygenase HmoA
MPPITTLSFYYFSGRKNILWGLSQNRKALRPLSQVPGLRFYKLMGSGAEGYSTYPDWNVYTILQVWDSLQSAEAYFGTHPLAAAYAERSQHAWQLYMKALRSKGSWSGINPFEGQISGIDPSGCIAVLTRATIRKRYLRRFWKYVPHSQRPLESAEGLIFHKGIGEVPYLQMATFSLWETDAAMKAFAYGTAAHKTAIAKTRELDWYREELFARFTLFKIVGEWPGVPELTNLLPK